MKVFAVVFAILVAAVTYVSAAGYGGGGSSGGYGGGSSAPVSVAAPPCPKNYVFSCQPSLSAAPCSPQSSASHGGSYGSAGAYSEHYPKYVNAYAAPYPVGYQYQGVYY